MEICAAISGAVSGMPSLKFNNGLFLEFRVLARSRSRSETRAMRIFGPERLSDERNGGSLKSSEVLRNVRSAGKFFGFLF